MREDLLAKIRKHWTKYLPERVKQLRAAGVLQESMQGAANLAQKEIEHLRAQGYPEHAAEEVALKKFVYLEPEPGASMPAEQQAELDEMERQYQKAPPT